MPEYPPLLNISKHDAEMSTAYSLDTAAQLEDTNNQGYMASIEMFHQLHCLGMIRKFVHYDYYFEADPKWANAPLVVQHVDHCIDMLREVLMCHGDTGLIVYHWIKGYPSPLPDFSTLHTCRDPEALLSWTAANAVDQRREVLRTGGEEDLLEVF